MACERYTNRRSGITRTIVRAASAAVCAPLLAFVPPALATYTPFNYEVQKHVNDQVLHFLSAPRTILDITEKFRRLGGFEHGMAASDRDAYLKFSYSLLLQFNDMDMIYYGLEDGTMVGYGRGWGTYREPGNSGYRTSDIPSDMLKYWKACVDPRTGDQKNCSMDIEISYIECPERGCALEKCPDTESQIDCSSFLQKDEILKCQQKIKYCRNYLHANVPQEDLGMLGYVPRTYHCHNGHGKFVSENCFYRDSGVPVDRSYLIGDYAYCGGGGKNCSDTFVGGYRNEDYDPRWREWYKEVKAEQRELWSNPYHFFTTLDMGITYTKPIYSQEGGNKRVFQGVLATDYTFKSISEFLHQSYFNTSTLVAICEDADPWFVIGSSTGSKPARKVLASDESQPCADGDIFLRGGECVGVRVKMAEISGSPMDDVLARAFEKLRKENFPSEQLLTIRESEDDISSSVRVVQSQILHPPDSNLKWRIMVVMPSNQDNSSAITPEDGPLFATVCVISGVGSALCIILFWALYSKRNEEAVICADWRLTEAFILGCILLNITTVALLGPNVDPLCMLRMWSFHFFFVATLSPLLVKIWRMIKLVGSLRRTQISHMQATIRAMPLIAVEVIILVIFSIVDPPKETAVVENSEEGILTERTVCRHDSDAFLIIQFTFETGLVLLGCVLSYLSRNLDPMFGEAKQLIAAMYNIAFVGIIIFMLVRLLGVEERAKIVLQAVGVLWGTVFSTCAFVLPRLLAVRDAYIRSRAGLRESTRAGNPNGTGRFTLSRRLAMRSSKLTTYRRNFFEQCKAETFEKDKGSVEH